MAGSRFALFHIHQINSHNDCDDDGTVNIVIISCPVSVDCFMRVKDPFEINVKKRASGTFNDPTLIPSMYEKRMIGCVCKYWYYYSTAFIDI